MRHTEHYIRGSRDRKLFTQTWQPGVPRGVFLVVHGLGEHSGRYAGLAAHFVERGWAVVALDHNGHGKSEGTPGFMEDIDDFVRDIHLVRQRIEFDFPAVPLFLLGHSLGGLISSLYLSRYQEGVTGVVLSGALIRTPDHPGNVQRALISLLARFVPRLGLIKLDAAGVSRDSAVVRQYENDPLVFHGRMTVGQLHEMFDAMDRVVEQGRSISLPILVLHGESDHMTDPAGSRQLFDLVASSDKTLTIYPRLYHEIFNEPENPAVYADVLDWCDQRRLLV